MDKVVLVYKILFNVFLAGVLIFLGRECVQPESTIALLIYSVFIGAVFAAIGLKFLSGDGWPTPLSSDILFVLLFSFSVAVTSAYKVYPKMSVTPVLYLVLSFCAFIAGMLITKGLRFADKKWR